MHSELSQREKQDVLSKTPDGQRNFVRGHLPLSDLPDFLKGEKVFETPVYAVWGNHEDLEVVKKFHTGEYQVENLHVLHEDATFHIGNLHVFGLGGNFLLGKKLFQKPLAGGSGKVWSVLEQYLRLQEAVEVNRRDEESRVFVSHVSPGKEAFVTLMGIHTRANLIVSGHMGPPFPMVWNDFAVREFPEALGRVKKRIEDIEQAYGSLDAGGNAHYDEALSWLADLPTDTVRVGRGGSVPTWYVNLFNVNLPDLQNGYAVLETKGGTLSIH